MDLTRHLVSTADAEGLLINILILALIPAAGEELLFRGILQPIFRKWTGSGIWAVMITAILFSTLHLQFYGFLPRMILGMVFGFLFMWSGTIWLPFIAHLVNNIMPVIASYYVGWERINEGITEIVPTDASSVIIIVILPSVLLYLLWDYYNAR